MRGGPGGLGPNGDAPPTALPSHYDDPAWPALQGLACLLRGALWPSPPPSALGGHCQQQRCPCAHWTVPQTPLSSCLPCLGACSTSEDTEVGRGRDPGTGTEEGFSPCWCWEAGWPASGGEGTDIFLSERGVGGGGGRGKGLRRSWNLRAQEAGRRCCGATGRTSPSPPLLGL